MKDYRLSMDGLPPAEGQRLRVFMQYLDVSHGVTWHLAAPEEGVDLLLWGHETPPDPQRHPHRLLAWVLPPEAPHLQRDLELHRPCQLEGFVGLLRRAELRLALLAAGHGRRVAATPPPAEMQTVPAAARQSLPPPAGVTHPPRPAGPAPAPSGTRFYRLRRWPDRGLLGGHPLHLRLAGYLATRPLPLAQISRLSGLSAAQCQDFLDLLEHHQLLDVCVGAPPPPPPPPALRAAPVTIDANPAPRRSAGVADGPPARAPAPAPAGFISRLRSHLGLN
ncbi:hypothetical protein [Ideonella livida]|uniref:Uncharacterized protein n=1 Tax=Ideonella livida TaxID=2707176 RepID=A0A7C9TKQ6_9BURK|nr:hypothetical protein [Ideonella livida]NDY92901.1 hypothetical protein [Ideonella livida]